MKNKKHIITVLGITSLMFLVAKNQPIEPQTIELPMPNLELCSVEPFIVNETLLEAEEEEETFIYYTMKDVPTNNGFKSYMDAKFITDKSSPQYALKQQYELSDNGIYMVDNRYCVAMGSYYSVDIGTKIDILMDNGAVLECILADLKNNKHTDKTNRQNPNGSILEFVVCTKAMPKLPKEMGDISYMSDEFKGEISSVIIYEES